MHPAAVLLSPLRQQEESLRIDLVYSCDRPPLMVAMLVAMLLEHVERGGGGGGVTGAVRSCSARTQTHINTHAGTHKLVEDETANKQENIWAVRTSPHRLRHAPHIHTHTLTHMQTHTFPSCWFGWGHV